MNNMGLFDILVMVVFYAVMSLVVAYLIVNGYTEVFLNKTLYTPEYGVYSGIANLCGGLAVAGFTIAVANL